MKFNLSTTIVSAISLLLSSTSSSFCPFGTGVLTVVTAQPPVCEDVLQARLDCYDTDGPCEPLPIPSIAFGPYSPDPTKGYVIQTIRDGSIYAIGDGAYWMMMAIAPTNKKMTKYEIALFDFPEGNFVQRDPTTNQIVGSTITNAIDEVVFEMHQLEPDHIEKVKMIYSHGHMDHIGAATIVYNHIMESWMPKRMNIIAHEKVLIEFETRIEANYYSFRAPLPDTLVYEDEEEDFKIGRSLKFSLTPLRGHSDDKDLVVFFEKDYDDDTDNSPAIMMFVDVIFPGWAPFFSFAISTDVFAFLDAHEFLLDHFDLGDDGIFIGGHLSKLGNRQDIITSSEFGQAVMAGALQGLSTVDIGPIAGGSGVFDPNSRNVGNSWHLFDLYFKEVVKVCVKQVVAEWGCKLGAVDIVIDSHCNSAQSFWRVDY